MHDFAEAALIAGRSYGLGADLDVVGIAPFGQVVLLQPLLDELTTFPRGQPSSWQPLLRRPLLHLAKGDFDRLLRELQPLLCDPPTFSPATPPLARPAGQHAQAFGSGSV